MIFWLFTLLTASTYAQSTPKNETQVPLGVDHIVVVGDGTIREFTPHVVEANIGDTVTFVFKVNSPLSSLPPPPTFLFLYLSGFASSHIGITLKGIK